MIGLGVMGGEICRHVAASEHRTFAYDSSPEAIDRARAHGAIALENQREASQKADVLLLSLPGPVEVTSVILGPDGVLTAADPPDWIIDLSTNSLDTVRKLAALCKDRGVTYIDGPVSGGRAKAISGELSLMLGVDGELPEDVLSVVGTFAHQIFVTGAVGTATVAKLANNQLFLTACAALQESYLMASAAGIDLDTLHSVLRSSSAGPIAALAPFLMRRNFDDVGFRLDIAAKDLVLAAELAESVGVDAPISAAAGQLYQRAIGEGLGGLDFHGLLRCLESAAGHEAAQLSRRGQ